MLGDFLQFQGFRRRNDALFVKFGKRQLNGLGAGSHHHVLGGNVGSTLGAGHRNGVGVHKGTNAAQDVDVVLFHQKVNPAHGGVDDGLLPFDHLGQIDLGSSTVNAVFGKMVHGVVKVLGRVQKSLGRDAAHVEARTP